MKVAIRVPNDDDFFAVKLCFQLTVCLRVVDPNNGGTSGIEPATEAVLET